MSFYVGIMMDLIEANRQRENNLETAAYTMKKIFNNREEEGTNQCR